jgi:FtsP/CotA-like multicopper oxidase with cupredoxin domain
MGVVATLFTPLLPAVPSRGAGLAGMPTASAIAPRVQKPRRLRVAPGPMQVADMVTDAPGSWLFHCHSNDHILVGMQARYHLAANR